VPTTTEFTVLLEDRAGTLAKLTRALGDREVNIVGFQSFPIGGRSVVRFVPDNPTTAKSVLEAARYTYFEAQVAQLRLAHRPGQLASAAARLSEAYVNISYAYVGIDRDTKEPIAFFGISDAARAVTVLDRPAAAGA
jgi:hypothetical protein